MVADRDCASWPKPLFAELQFSPNRSADTGTVHVQLYHQCDYDWMHVVMASFHTAIAPDSQ